METLENEMTLVIPFIVYKTEYKPMFLQPHSKRLDKWRRLENSQLDLAFPETQNSALFSKTWFSSPPSSFFLAKKKQLN